MLVIRIRQVNKIIPKFRLTPYVHIFLLDRKKKMTAAMKLFLTKT